MGEDLYRSYWESLLPTIIEKFDEGNAIVQLPVNGLAAYGIRKDYYSNFVINKGVLEIPKNARAQGRDLYSVLLSSVYFQDYLFESKIQVTISKDLVLKMEILDIDAPEFFTEEDFSILTRFGSHPKQKNSEEHENAYKSLASAYSKVEHWAKQVQQKLFPDGAFRIRKKPTNQANYFDFYLWSQIYPDKSSLEYRHLAYTVEINTDGCFLVKIDTVRLGEDDERRKKYANYRGNYQTSQIVKPIPHEQVLEKGWKYLIDLTCNILLGFKEDYFELFHQLSGMKIAINYSKGPVRTAPLNQILFGPPGTGKTFHRINKAIEIIDPEFYNINKDDRKLLKRRFKDLLIKDLNEGNGQIAFATFHQSLSYEDFIEGIKPLKPQLGEDLKYDLVDGIFKLISDTAKSNFENSKLVNSEKLPFEAAFEQLKEEWENSPQMQFPLKTVGYDYTILGFTKSSVQFKKASGGTSHTLSINTLKELYYGKEFNFKQGVGIYYPGILSKLNSYEKVSGPIKLLNYVLIIDEINRGNVSQIFGELITLLEDDKRDGELEALEVILPYSKERFSIPPNLYVIGTMNTADRSVEALDTALRRRFSFEEILPNPKHPRIGIVEGINLGSVLEKINKRLEKLLSRDHTIGHSFFIDVNTKSKLWKAFNNKVMPLLQEYFFGDYGKIGLVLGKAFVEEVTIADSENNFFADFDYEEKDLFLEKKVYRINGFEDDDDYTNFLAAVKSI